MKDTTMFKRGQVWFIGDNRETEGHIQRGPRPYLVVSNDVCNTYSNILHLAPITSQPKCDIPTHVTYKDWQGKENTILLEQITIRSIPHMLKCARYKYTLSDEIMSEVDGAIMTQFQIAVIDDEEDFSDQYEEEDTQEFDDSDITESEVCATSEDKPISQIDKFNARMGKYKELNGPEIKRTKSGNIIWTEDLKTQFLRDYVSLGSRKAGEKYGISKSTCSSNAARFRREREGE